jgi:hypothetical protein
MIQKIQPAAIKYLGDFSDCLRELEIMIVDTEVSKVATEPQLTGSPGKSQAWRLLLVSSAALYLEMVLIRWIGTEVRIFAFFQNLSLIACFLGFGLGCFNSKQRGSLLPSLAAVATLVAIVNLPVQLVQRGVAMMSAALSFSPDAAMWGTSLKLTPSEYWILTVSAVFSLALFLVLLVIAMAPLGRWVGYYLEASADTITAYSVNLAGSLVGMWLLALLALLWLSPPYWFALAFILILAAEPLSWRTGIVGAVLLLVTIFALRPVAGKAVYWSPYQKLEVTSQGENQYQIDVNNVGYMAIANVSPELLARYPEVARTYESSSYDSPFHFALSNKRVLDYRLGRGQRYCGGAAAWSGARGCRRNRSVDLFHRQTPAPGASLRLAESPRGDQRRSEFSPAEPPAI